MHARPGRPPSSPPCWAGGTLLRQGGSPCCLACPAAVAALRPLQVLAEAGFLYDSTILEEVHASLSSGPASRVFPYTMQDGIPQNCGWWVGARARLRAACGRDVLRTQRRAACMQPQPLPLSPHELPPLAASHTSRYAPEQTCNATERYPGMFEVPLWPLAAKGLYSMDCGADGLFSVFDILKANFDAAYSGNRAPLPTYIHTPWLSTAHVADMQRFAGGEREGSRQAALAELGGT